MAGLPVLERLARRRRLTPFALAAVLAACGGRTPPPAGGPPPPPDAGEPDAEPAPDAPPLDPCAAYQLAVSPALGRIATAVDRLANAEGLDDVASKSGKLAEVIDVETALLGSLTTGIPDLDAAHAAVVATLPALAQAARDVGKAAAEVQADAKGNAAPLRKALRGLLQRAGEYKKATEAVEAICP